MFSIIIFSDKQVIYMAALFQLQEFSDLGQSINYIIKVIQECSVCRRTMRLSFVVTPSDG